MQIDTTLTLSQAQRTLSGRHLRQFTLAWTWSAPRFAGHAAHLQDRYYDHRGHQAYRRRVDRMRRALGFAPLYTTT